MVTLSSLAVFQESTSDATEHPEVMMVYQLFTSTYTREEAKSVNNEISRLEVTIICHVSMCHVSATFKITVLAFDLTTNSEFGVVQFLEENRKRSGSYNLHVTKITKLNGAAGEGTC